MAKKHRARAEVDATDGLKADAVKALFMKSDYVEWSPFALSMRWNASSTRHKFPVANWVREKKEQVAKEQAESIADAIFRHKPRWHENVLKVMRDSVQLTDQIEQIFKVRVNQVVSMINRDVQNKQKALLEGRPYDDTVDSEFYEKVNNAQLEILARTAKAIVEAKQRSVLINNWSVNVAEEFAKPETILQETQSRGFTVEVFSDAKEARKITSEELISFRKKFYDQAVTPRDDEDKGDEG